jgi:predicted transcriptional regulator
VQSVEERVTVSKAAELLGTTEAAVRQRLYRNTLRHEKDADGRVYVYLTEDDMRSAMGGNTRGTGAEQGVNNALNDALHESLTERIESLERQLDLEREANRENRRLLAAALERIPPQLESPQSPPESSQTASEEQSGTPPAQERDFSEGEQTRRSWWYRIFIGSS